MSIIPTLPRPGEWGEGGGGKGGGSDTGSRGVAWWDGGAAVRSCDVLYR